MSTTISVCPGVTAASAPVGDVPCREPRLPRRLRALLEVVPRSPAVADIGAGHGALAVHLQRRGCRVIAVERGAGPLAELRRNLAAWRASDAVEVRDGDGLEPLGADEVEGAVIAGLGARTVLRICEGAPGKVRWLVLQCVQDADLVAPWLERRGWEATHTSRVEQGRHAYATWLVGVPRP